MTPASAADSHAGNILVYSNYEIAQSGE